MRKIDFFFFFLKLSLRPKRLDLVFKILNYLMLVSRVPLIFKSILQYLQFDLEELACLGLFLPIG